LQGLEALSSGTVIMVSDIPVFREIYQQSALYFDPINFESIKIAMQGVLSMEAIKRRAMIDEAKVFVKRYSWNKMAQETMKLYIEAANE
jgi:glycosyltransferase involved in cell wall biosynthesis